MRNAFLIIFDCKILLTQKNNPKNSKNVTFYYILDLKNNYTAYFKGKENQKLQIHLAQNYDFVFHKFIKK